MIYQMPVNYYSLFLHLNTPDNWAGRLDLINAYLLVPWIFLPKKTLTLSKIKIFGSSKGESSFIF